MNTKKDSILNKIKTLKTLQQNLRIWRLKGDRIVFTNGCFDLLHPGHIELLAIAANLGNRLIIGLNNDASVKRLKGNDRPIQTEQERTFMLASLLFTDAVILFEEETPLNLIRKVKPDVLVKGGDYKEEDIIGANFVKKQGGEIVIVPLKVGFSTTNLINKLKWDV